MKTLLVPALRLFGLLAVVTGLAYPLALTAVAHLLFRQQATGSQVVRDGRVVGSDWLAQKFASPAYFHPRPSAVDYATVASGASNLGPTSAALDQVIAERASAWGLPESAVPAELLLASGSGLDPHLSPEAASFQAARVAAARGLAAESIVRLINDLTEPPQLGLLGQARINVLRLNLALDTLP